MVERSLSTRLARRTRRPRRTDADAATLAATDEHAETGVPTRIAALQRAAGNSAVARRLQRDFAPVTPSGWNVRFHIGTEIDVKLAGEAFARTASGPLGDADLGALRDIALEHDRTIDDHERLFLAALLDANVAARLHQQHPKGLDAADIVLVSGADISSDNRDRVKDYGREPAAEATSMTIGAKGRGARERIVALAGPGFATAIKQVLAIAEADRVPLERVEEAMIAAASDSTSGDRVMAGAAYVIALHGQLPAASDILSGSIKVDEVPATAIAGTAEYRSMGGAGKGDTVYLPSTFDVASLAFQGLLVHELTHAQNDKAAAGFSAIDRWKEELGGYRAQGRYWLTELAKLKPAAQATAITKLAPSANTLSILAMLVEDRAANKTGWWALIEQINRASANGLSTTEFGAANDDTDAQLEQRALTAIRTSPGYARMSATTPVDGLRGESFLDE